jgi:uncharacterized protein
MTKILGSTHSFLREDDEKALEFISIVSDIPAVAEYRQLQNQRQHHSTSRYQHCLNVAWYSYLMAKQAGLDYRSCARGAMLHDFYLYDWHQGTPMPGRHCSVHPKVALQNAEKYFDLNETEKDCILYHMWPNGTKKPKTREGLIVTIADKYCAFLEFTSRPVLAVPHAFSFAYHAILN